MKRRTAKRAARARAGANGGDDNMKKGGRLVKYEALPDYLKDNEFITDYYRCEWPLKDIVLSIFSVHNETLNIWTHLIGFLIFLWLMVMSLTDKMKPENVIAALFGEGSDGWLKTKMMNQSNDSNAIFSVSANFSLTKTIRAPPDPHVVSGKLGSRKIRVWAYTKLESYTTLFAKSTIFGAKEDTNSVPLWPWIVFLVGAMGCLIFSSISHLFACHSRRFYYFFWRLDYTGISLMIVCSFFAPIYYTFSDYPEWRFFYLSSITLVGILVVITLLSPALSSGRFRSFRATLFLCMGFSGVIPAAHAVVLHWGHRQILWSLVYEIVMGLLYGVGAVFYMTRIPERWKPGAFDIVGHSHQIFHVFVVAAALSHSAATMIIMEWRRGLQA
ncbi:UNVERIFIED_CONTAM: Heptahelical transmembrane protein 2 [Sesamum calycinum]|uniref:Heptahelical transmembrane protein 2 n=1 Tax=Sesamum calycinum TaxID=2727403 RepID=A0AAW2N483_9LAMI